VIHVGAGAMSRDHYTGRSGELAVIAELLHQGCNAAMPLVDVGEDIFAFKDDREDVARIQVKTALNPMVYKKGDGFAALFSIPLKQLDRDDRPPLFYVLAIRHLDRWSDFIVVGRETLRNYYNGEKEFGIKDKNGDNLNLYIRFRAESTFCKQVDLHPYRNRWDCLPPLKPLADPGAPAGPLPD
jgi:hypothetical protein